MLCCSEAGKVTVGLAAIGLAFRFHWFIHLYRLEA